MLHQHGRVTDPETRGLLTTMHSNGMRLLKLINDLLDLVRLESGHMEVKRDPLELTDFIKGLASAVRQVADDKRIRLETWVAPELVSVLADRDKLEKILLNLLFNALKFTPAGGRVDLRAEKQGDEFVLLVKDTGMGISQKNLPHVFDRFWQADGSARRKYQGVGIGLALVKELTEVQGGTVSVESEEGKGTTFTVRFPCEKAEPKREAPAEATEEAVEAHERDELPNDLDVDQKDRDEQEALIERERRTDQDEDDHQVEVDAARYRKRCARWRRPALAIAPVFWWRTTSRICCAF